MSRIALALLLGLAGFTLYVGVAVTLADQVLGTHWAVELLYFLLAGTLWAIPARRLMLSAAARG